MKRIIAVLSISFLLFSCSSDDSNTPPAQEQLVFFPLTENSYWTYNNENETGVTRDSLFVAGTQLLNGRTYTNLDALEPVSGFMTQILSDNLIHDTGSQLLLSGELSTPIIDGFPALSIDLDEFVLLDTNVTDPGTVLSSITGELSEVIMEIPLVFTYELQSIHNSFISNPSTNSVTETKLVLNLSVVAEINVAGIVISIPVLASQDVMVATNRFVENAGLQVSTVQIEYELEDLSGTGIEFPIPSQGSTTATQTLDDYTIGD